MDSLKEICEETLLCDVDDDTVLLYMGLAEQFPVPRLKVLRGRISNTNLYSSCHWNNHTLGFNPQTQKLEPPCTA